MFIQDFSLLPLRNYEIKPSRMLYCNYDYISLQTREKPRCCDRVSALLLIIFSFGLVLACPFSRKSWKRKWLGKENVVYLREDLFPAEWKNSHKLSKIQIQAKVLQEKTRGTL
jgi:hypothetical protein